MKRHDQSGISSLSLLVILAAAAFFLLVGFKVGPLYIDNYFVSAALKQMGDEPLLEMRDDEIRRKLQSYFLINNVRDISMRQVQVERDREGVLIKVDYEKRVNFLGNADVVVAFTNHLHSADYR